MYIDTFLPFLCHQITHEHTQFTYLPAYLIGVFVINSLMNSHVDQKYVQFGLYRFLIIHRGGPDPRLGTTDLGYRKPFFWFVLIYLNK